MYFVIIEKESFWIIGAIQESKSSNVLVSILEFVKKYYLPRSCRSLASIINKLFPPSIERFFLIHYLFLHFFCFYCHLLLIEFNNRVCCRRSKIPSFEKQKSFFIKIVNTWNNIFFQLVDSNNKMKLVIFIRRKVFPDDLSPFLSIRYVKNAQTTKYQSTYRKLQDYFRR